MLISTPAMFGFTSSAAPVRECLFVLLEPEIDLPVTRERAEMARIALHDLAAVGQRAPVVAGEEVGGGALVPAFGEGGLAADDLAESLDRLRKAPRLHLLDARCQPPVDARVPRAGPQQPRALLGVAAHERTLIAQALEQQRLVGHAAVIGKPGHGLGAGLCLRGLQRGEGLGASLRRRECIRGAAC